MFFYKSEVLTSVLFTTQGSVNIYDDRMILPSEFKTNQIFGLD